ncbi:hypothetical protein HYY69_00850 [Candidatus Woesearchaeota archaeon]|nr:hypothetical protein [Candidatus Woesearchaeota archaeon]
MNNLKLFAWTGIIITVVHLTIYFIKPYNFVLFMIGFGIIYLVFVQGIKYIKHKYNI